jgi:hypothetical protein
MRPRLAFAKNAAILPFEPDLGSNNHLVAQATFGYRLADDLLRAAKSVGRSSVDDIDAMVQGSADGGNGFGFIGAAPHPTADGPGADRNGRHFQRRSRNSGCFHIDFESFSLMSHDTVASCRAGVGLLAAEACNADAF